MTLKLELESETSLNLSLAQSETGDVSAEIASVQAEPDALCSKPSVSIEVKNDGHIFTQHGYKKMNILCDTLQGELYKASMINKTTNKLEYVAIKKTSKQLFLERIAIRDEMAFCVSENILKEALILKHLSVQNQEIGNFFIKYVDFFQSDSDYYLVTEYIHSETNLKQFVKKANLFVNTGKLDYKTYKKVIKYIMWQLCVAVQWLHQSIHCAHLDLCMENIMLKNARFIQNKNGVSIDANISVKIQNFGVAEIFESNDKNNSFVCSKQGLTLDNECCAAPNVFHMYNYDALLSDNWSLGIILFRCMTLGLELYEPMSMHQKSSGYHALYTNTLKQYIITKNMSKYFNSATFELLQGLLHVKECDRLRGMDIFKTKFFKMYYERYGKRIIEEFDQQKEQTAKQKIRMKEKKFPFYKHS